MHAVAAQSPDLHAGHQAQQILQQQGSVNVPALLACYHVKLHHSLQRRAPYAFQPYQPLFQGAIKDFSFKDFNARYAPLCMS